jgi:dihydrodipicolinate synthase/N-acetylneuraminate lyase
MLVAQRFVDCARGRFQVVVHAGAQSTKDTVALAAHAASIGADAVAVIGPPYFAPDHRGLVEHFVAAGQACPDRPYYLYEFAARTGYHLSRELVDAVHDRLPNLCGMKVSNSAWDQVEPYLVEGLDLLVGYEPLLHRAKQAGAVGTVSGLATAFPEEVRAAERLPAEGAALHLEGLRQALNSVPTHSGLEWALAKQGLAISTRVRSPLRAIDQGEKELLDRLLSATLSWWPPSPGQAGPPQAG